MKIVSGLLSVFLALCYFVKLIVKTGFRCYVPRNVAGGRKLLVLVNGPSLNDSWDEIIATKRNETDDIITVNFAANDERFYITKPKYYLITDPMFYYPNEHPREEKERVVLFFENLNTRVDWDMILFLSTQLFRAEKKAKKVSNPHIRIIPFHGLLTFIRPITWRMKTGRRIIMYFAKKGLFSPDRDTVMHFAIYLGFLMGYKVEELYGADHNFLEGLMVNDKNQVCKRTVHFYETDAALKPVGAASVNGVGVVCSTVGVLLSLYEQVFKGHELLRMIADEMGVRVINMTKGSMIDVYERP